MSEIEYTKLTDEKLILMFQKGEIKAYNELVRRYKDKLLNFINGYMHDIDVAENLTQDTLIKVYTHGNSFKEIAKFSTWLYTIAGNLAKTELRKLKRRKTYSFSQLSNNEYEFNLDRKVYESSEGNEPNRRDDYELVLVSIDKLPQEMREIIVLRDIQELSYEDISIILALPVGTVKSRINRARLKTLELVKEIKKEKEEIRIK